jgi:IS5 family transposase
MKVKGVEIAVPIFGDKNHAVIDRHHGFIRRWNVTSAAAHDSRPFEGLLDPKNTASADTAYRLKRNEAAMAKRGLISKVHFRKRRKSRCRSGMLGRMRRDRRCAPQASTFCRTEASHEAVRAHHRHRPRRSENRHGQPRLQLQPPRLARSPNRVRLTGFTPDQAP